jgi:hypothetical protein
MSHGRNKYQSRENRARVRELFMRDWDPIGVRGIPGCEDEYDRYVDKAYVMLMDEGATEGEIADYLYYIACEWMGMGESEERKERSEEVARTLVSLRPEFQTH